MGPLPRARFAGFNDAEMDQFEALLQLPDQDVFAWLQGFAAVPVAHDTAMFGRMKALCSRKDPTWNV